MAGLIPASLFIDHFIMHAPEQYLREKKLILDLHVHSKFSGDSPVHPEEYAKKVNELQKDYHIDGFVLMEHNFWVRNEDCDLFEISQKHKITILSGAEIDTHWGHILVYGINEKIYEFCHAGSTRKKDPVELSKIVMEEGGVCVPAHPFRSFFIGCGTRCSELSGIRAIEGINGSNEKKENDAALAYARKNKYLITGGSDGHYLAEIGNTMTKFNAPVNNMEELVRELKNSAFEAVTLDQCRK
jgi:predicted metal-dependent phosphoesterase TrpH